MPGVHADAPGRGRPPAAFEAALCLPRDARWPGSDTCATAGPRRRPVWDGRRLPGSQLVAPSPHVAGVAVRYIYARIGSRGRLPPACTRRGAGVSQVSDGLTALGLVVTGPVRYAIARINRALQTGSGERAQRPVAGRSRRVRDDTRRVPDDLS